MSDKNRRRYKNLFFGRHKNIKLAVYTTMIPAFAMFLAACFLFYLFGKNYATYAPEMFKNSHSGAIAFNELSLQYYALLAMAFSGFGIIGFWICNKISRELVGPFVAVERHIQQLIDGEYDKRIQLRESDFLVEVCQLLNQLAKELEEKDKAQ